MNNEYTPGFAGFAAVASRFARRLAPLGLALAAICHLSSAQNILSERYDDARTGANLTETQLTTANVNVSHFGKLFSHTVSGSTQAQLLYVANVNIPGKGTHNVIYVATMNDVLYAFDADDASGANANPLWVHDFTNSSAGITPVPIADIVGSNGLNIVGNVGIESTPVIDPSTNIMYLVARTKENGSYFQRLHAVAIDTGADVSGSPVEIKGSVGSRSFDPKIHNQRASLAVAHGKVFIAWASHEDKNSYHGWVMAYDTTTLAQAGIFCVTPSGSEGGIWMGGWAPAIDASGNVFYIAGNGSFNGTNEFGESFLRFDTTTGLTLTDFFTPDNWASLNSGDTDMGASGAMLIPRTSLIIGGSKGSILYLLHANNLGHEQTGNGQAVQLLHLSAGEVKGGPVYWDRPSGAGPWLYVWAENDFLKAFHFNGTTFDTTTVSKSTVKAPSGNSTGVLALSANGTASGTGIVWASIAINKSADHGVVPGMLRAFDAENLTHELWNSEQNASRDSLGNWPKFSAPVVTNGKVYMGSFSGHISAYGLLSSPPPQAAAPTFAPPGGSFTTPQSVTISTTTAGASIRYTTDGSTPSETNGTLYSGPVPISTTTTLKAIAFASGFTDSLITSEVYSFGTGTTVSFEAESLARTSTGATTSIQSDTKSSGGKWVELAGNSVGDFVEFTLPNVSAGTYTLEMMWKGNNNRGILNLKVDGTQLGGTLDQYSAAQSYPTTTFGTITFSTTGNHTVRLTVTGKNGSSGGENLSADKFILAAP